MVLYFIGLGLGDERDITLRGLDVVRSCTHVFLDGYTSMLGVDRPRLEALYGRDVIVADREMIEERADVILDVARDGDVAFLVVGDVFGATTHHDLWLRAHTSSIPCELVHNAGIMSAVGACGLQLYRFGETVSLVFFTDRWRPSSWYEKIVANRRAGLHTLCLLDIRVKEPTEESLARGRKQYENPRYMTIGDAIRQILEVANGREMVSRPHEQSLEECHRQTLGIGLARVGQKSQKILVGELSELMDIDFGPPLHCLVIPGDMHEMERTFVATLPRAPRRI